MDDSKKATQTKILVLFGLILVFLTILATIMLVFDGDDPIDSTEITEVTRPSVPVILTEEEEAYDSFLSRDSTASEAIDELVDQYESVRTDFTKQDLVNVSLQGDSPRSIEDITNEEVVAQNEAQQQLKISIFENVLNICLEDPEILCEGIFLTKFADIDGIEELAANVDASKE